MDIKPATAAPPARPSTDTYFALIERLRALPGIEAEVLRRAPGWMVLRTPLGKLLTANSLPLQDGDRVRLRIAEHGGQPLLKLAPLARRPLAPLALEAARHPRLEAAFRTTAGQVVLGIVERVGARAMSARFAAGAEKLPPIDGAARGDWLMLRKHRASGRIEVFPVEREAVNRALLRRLLPELQGAPGNNLSRLARLLLRGVDALARDSAGGTPPTAATGRGARPAPPNAAPVNPARGASSVTAQSTPAANRPAAPPGPPGPPGPPSLSPNLQQLFDYLPRLPGVDAAAIRKWFEFLQLARPAPGNGGSAAAASLPALLFRMLDTERLGNELQAAVRARSQTAGADDAEPPAQREAVMQLARDVARLAEQGLAQNLGGRASANLQQEAQQLFSISLTVPLLDRDDVQPLRIDLRQRGGADENSPQSWDIRLDFEFDGLGAVACHGVLAERQVVASFYCAVPATRELIETALPELRRSLQLAGFEAGDLHSFAGSPPSVDTAPAQAPSGLIDLRA